MGNAYQDVFFSKDDYGDPMIESFRNVRDRGMTILCWQVEGFVGGFVCSIVLSR